MNNLDKNDLAICAAGIQCLIDSATAKHDSITMRECKSEAKRLEKKQHQNTVDRLQALADKIANNFEIVE